jgi:hypothetical protein
VPRVDRDPVRRVPRLADLANGFANNGSGRAWIDLDPASAHRACEQPERTILDASGQASSCYGSDGLLSCGRRTGFFSRCTGGWLRLVLSYVLSDRLRRLRL